MIRDISGTVRSAFERMQIPQEKLGMELSYMLHTCIRELVSNTVMHSDQTSFLCAITLSRETGKNTRPHRPGVESESGAHTYDILVMDFGQGVLRSAQDALGLDFLGPDSDYFKALPWRPEFKSDQARERRLLESLFKNDLIIRRGRRSEGLSEVAKAAQWFGGAFHYRTGRTGLVVAGTGMELAIKEPVWKKGPYFTPGIVAAFSLPSPQLQQVTMDLHRRKLTASPLRQQERPAYIHRALPAPSGLFGGAGNFPIRRRSELDAADIQDRLRRLDKPGQVLQIDIRLSDGLDTHFFDSLLQELTKRVRLADLRRAHHMLGRLLFTNVPRRIVNALRRGNCAAFMLFKSTFAILLDETDQPHFIGVTRLSKASNDLAECLLLIWNAHAISESELRGQLKPDEATMERLRDIVPEDEGSILWWKETDQGVVYYCLDVQKSLSRERRERISVADTYAVDGAPAGLQLLNGVVVDSVVDFGLFWSEENCALECGKELLHVSPFPAVDTVVSFMNNGERLALAIQRFTNATSLIVVDPKSPENWDTLDASAECIIVVDAILHPSHTVGATLAQMVTSILGMKVTTFPLAQRRYGGKIEPTEQDYRYMQRLTDSVRAPGRQPRALILDDSVITGQSLFTMLGIGHRIGVRVVGIFVLLNRLTPEVSDALSQHGIHFGYLYRLHMPLLAGDDSPDEELKRLNTEVASNVSSVLCARWCVRLADEKSHFLSDAENIDQDCPRLPNLLTCESILSGVGHLVDGALSAFQKARDLNSDDEHGYVTPIQTILLVAERMCQATGNSSISRLCARMDYVGEWVQQHISSAEELLERIQHFRGQRKPSEHERRCHIDLTAIYGDFDALIATWEKVLDRSAGQIWLRKAVAHAYVARKDRIWNSLSADELRRIVELSECNLGFDPTSEGDLRTWFHAYRFLPEFSYSEALVRIQSWASRADSVDAHYYLYILHFLRWNANGERDEELIQSHLKRSAELSIGRRDNSYEWFAVEPAWCPLINSRELGGWSDQKNFFHDTTKLAYMEGTISSLKRTAGMIRIGDITKAFFRPPPHIRESEHINATVHFHLGFSYERLHAWNVELGPIPPGCRGS